ncbi:hypothetical protein B0H17DRAFT_1140445 [Mycena rosella]|uniref:Uncharacterized protein n=1 Tax=Mycena rosella TaxID=1033263 RepID=A0AAD7D1W4_MYCRO|nr:hypothetical protein B0H17DRAFT_1140445 [Mycena rosella]
MCPDKNWEIWDVRDLAFKGKIRGPVESSRVPKAPTGRGYFWLPSSLRTTNADGSPSDRSFSKPKFEHAQDSRDEGLWTPLCFSVTCDGRQQGRYRRGNFGGHGGAKLPRARCTVHAEYFQPNGGYKVHWWDRAEQKREVQERNSVYNAGIEPSCQGA